MKTPLDIMSTVKRYGLNQQEQERLIQFSDFIWQECSIQSVDDLVAFEKKYCEYDKEFDFCYDTEHETFNAVDMHDFEMCLLTKCTFEAISRHINDRCFNNPSNAKLTELERVVIYSFIANISGLYRKDAYYYGIPPFVETVCNILNSAISKLAPYSDTVVRACNKYDKSIFQNGDKFQPQFCLTCSADLTWKNQNENRYIIHPLDSIYTKARSVFSICNNSEKQVTFLQDASFKITDIKEWGNDKLQIEMQETE